MERLTIKSSTILIAVNDETLVYHSVDEVPEALRERLLETTQGINSATILIADKGGREQLLEAVRKSRPERYSRLVAALMRRDQAPGLIPRRWMFLFPLLGRLLLVGSLGYVLWILARLP